MSNRDLANEWFNIAKADLESAIFLQNMKPVPIEIICYHCQQSAEKFLKGFITYHNRDITKTHDLLKLNNVCKAIDGHFSNIEQHCLRLTDFGVTVRYPYPMEINNTDMELAIKDAREVEEFVLARLDFKI